MPPVNKAKTEKKAIKKPDRVKVSIIKKVEKISIPQDIIMPKKESIKKPLEKQRTKIRIIDEETKIVKEGSQKIKMPVLQEVPPQIAPKQLVKKNISNENKAEHHGHANEVIDLTKKIEKKLLPNKILTNTISHPPQHKTLGLYKRIALAFIVLVIILLGIIFYTSFVKVKITIIPKQEKISSTSIIDVYDKNKPKQDEAEKSWIPGVIGSIVITETKSYPTTGEKPLNEEVVGNVTIYNNYIKNQPLVASTRLLTADGKLFRTRSTVNVPAGGSVEVEIYADEPTEITAVPAGKFTFPALWAGLQDKIYAESKTEMSKGSKVKHFVAQADIDAAIKDLRDAVIKKAKEQVYGDQKEYNQLLYLVDEASMKNSLDGKVNEEKESLSGTMSANVNYAFFSSREANDKIRAKFSTSIPKEKEVIIFDDQSVKYTLNNVDTVSSTATINASFEVNTTLKTESSIIDRKNIIGLTKDQLEQYLKTPEIAKDIASYNITFYPNFVKRVPNLADRIEIEIKK